MREKGKETQTDRVREREIQKRDEGDDRRLMTGTLLNDMFTSTVI